MKIQIHDIPSEGVSLDLDETSPELASLLGELGGEGGALSLRSHVQLTRDDEIVTVDGRVTGQVTQPCARCLDPVAIPIDEHFRFFMRPPPEGGHEEGEEIELSPDALDYGFLEGGAVDVPSLIQEQVLLALPSQPLCRPDCKGICQRCGAELNREACRCVDEVVDPRFAILKKLKAPSA